MNEDDKVFLTAEQAIAMLPDKAEIHTYRGAGPVLLGADWGREDLIVAMKKSKTIEVTGPMAQSMNHGIAFFDDHGAVFVETVKAAVVP